MVYRIFKSCLTLMSTRPRGRLGEWFGWTAYRLAVDPPVVLVDDEGSSASVDPSGDNSVALAECTFAYTLGCAKSLVE